MEDLHLIIAYDEPNSRLKSYLQEMRRQAEDAPNEEEIAEIVEEVRRDNYDKK